MVHYIYKAATIIAPTSSNQSLLESSYLECVFGHGRSVEGPLLDQVVLWPATSHLGRPVPAFQGLVVDEVLAVPLELGVRNTQG